MNAATNQPPILPNRLGQLSWAGQFDLLSNVNRYINLNMMKTTTEKMAAEIKKLVIENSAASS